MRGVGAGAMGQTQLFQQFREWKYPYRKFKDLSWNSIYINYITQYQNFKKIDLGELFVLKCKMHWRDFGAQW